jgi:hypothetical protein
MHPFTRLMVVNFNKDQVKRIARICTKQVLVTLCGSAGIIEGNNIEQALTNEIIKIELRKRKVVPQQPLQHVGAAPFNTPCEITVE